MSEQPWLKNYPVSWNLDYPELSLYDFFMQENEKYLDYTALIFFGTRVSYKEMRENIDRTAAALADLGVVKGDRVALMLPNCPHYVYLYYACMKIGAVVVQVNPLYTAYELEFILNDSEARVFTGIDLLFNTFNEIRDRVPVKTAIVCSLMGTAVEGDNLNFTELLVKYPPESKAACIDPREDVAVFQYTGGTTGSPKAAMLTHYNLVCNTLQSREFASPLLEDDDREPDELRYVIATLPFFHSFGMTVIMNAGLTALRPTCLILLPRPEPDLILELIKEYQPRVLAAVPTWYAAILTHPRVDEFKLQCLETCSSGSAPMAKELMQKFEDKTGSIILEGYGLSEASPVTHSTPPRGTRKVNSIGIPMPGTECRIVDIADGKKDVPVGEAGELIIRGPQVMKGYWNRPAETAETIRDGWLYTGDIAKMDEDGYFFIVDRKKEMIITKGFNVYPRDIDNVLYENPKVLEAVAVGIPDDYYGEKIKAYVVLNEGETATEDEIREFCARKLASYKVPREVEFRSELPKSAIGKILRRVLVEEEKRKTGGAD